MDNLPEGIQQIIVGDIFNQPINNLPSTLKHLVLGTRFDNSLDNLPESLEHLYIIRCKNLTQVSTNLPISLTELHCNINHRPLFTNFPLGCVVYYYETKCISVEKGVAYIQDLISTD